jgi:hypothetical protein
VQKQALTPESILASYKEAQRTMHSEIQARKDAEAKLPEYEAWCNEVAQASTASELYDDALDSED